MIKRHLLILALLAAGACFGLRAWAGEAEEPKAFGGVGMSLGLRDGPLVLGVVDGGPAARAGIKPGDRIVAVDGQPTAGLALEAVVAKVRGPVGSSLVVAIAREGAKKPVEFTLARETIRMDAGKQLALARQGADLGFPESQTDLGYQYYQGQAVSRDYREAMKWFRKAADQGSPRGQYFVGLLLYKGQGAAKDPAEAYAWWRKAADQGLFQAQHNLGYLYSRGEGVDRDDVLAYRWYLTASRAGDISALKDLNRLEPLLSPEQLAEAKRQAEGAQAKPSEAPRPVEPPSAPRAAIKPADAKALDEQLLP